MAREQLANVLKSNFGDIEIVKTTDSVSGSVDYLLKPISLDRLKRAVGRCRGKSGFRKLITIRYSNRIVPISTEKTAYIFSDNKANYLMTFNREKDWSGHFTVKLNPEPEEAFSVARPRISAFMKWMNNNN